MCLSQDEYVRLGYNCDKATEQSLLARILYYSYWKLIIDGIDK